MSSVAFPHLKQYQTWILALLLTFLIAAVYWPGLSGDFLFDDYPNILTNDRIHAKDWSWHSLVQAAQGFAPGLYGRPLATIGFAVDYLIGGKAPWGYKLHSLLVHLLNALLVQVLVIRLLSLPRAQFPGDQRDRAIVAFTIALLWAVHPLQVSSVLYIVQRMETLATTFVLLALLAYLRGRRAQIHGEGGWPWVVVSMLLAGAGMLSKEVAVLFPAFALALELTLLGFDARAERTRRTLKGVYAIGLSIALGIFVAWVLPRYTSDLAYSGRDFNLEQRLLTQLRVLPMYLGQMLLPLPDTLTFYYDALPVSTGWLKPPTTLLGGVLLAALLGTAWRVRQSAGLFSLGVFWFFAAHAITSNVFNLELAFEHRNYFALLGVLLASLWLVQRVPMRDGPALKYVAVAIAVIAFGFLAVIRTATWGDPVQLASDLAAKSPDSPRASSDLGAVYLGVAQNDPRSPFFTFAMHEFERGAHLPNSSPLPEQALILMAATTGQPVKDEWWDRLVHKVQTRPTSPQELMAVTGLMKQRYRGIPLDDRQLTRAFAALVQRDPRPELHVQFGDYALKYLNDEQLADEQFVAAVDSSRKGAVDYSLKIVGALTADGRIRQAQAMLQRMDELGINRNAGR